MRRWIIKRTVYRFLVIGVTAFPTGCIASVSATAPSTQTAQVSFSPVAVENTRTTAGDSLTATASRTFTSEPTKRSTPTATATMDTPPVNPALHTQALPEGAVARLGKGMVNQVTVSPAANAVAAATSIGVYVYRLGADGHTLEEAWFGPTATPLHSVAFSQDGKTLATGSEGSYNDYPCDPGQLNRPYGIITLWDVQTGEAIRDIKNSSCFIEQLEFTADGRSILYREYCFAGEYGPVLLNLETGKSVYVDQESESGMIHITGMAVSPDGNRIAAGYDRPEFLPEETHDYYAAIFDAAGQNRLFRLEGFNARITDMAFSPDNGLLAIGSGNGLVSLWDVSTGVKKSTLPSPGTGVTQIAFSHSGKTIAVSYGDGMIHLWGMSDGSRIRVMDGKGADVLAFSTEEPTLLSVGAGAPLIRWELLNGTARHVYSFDDLFGIKGLGRSLDISPDGKYLAAGGLGGSVTLFDLEKLQPVRTFHIQAKSGTRVAFSPDGKTLAGSADGAIRLWNYRTGAVLLSLEGDNPVFSPDGKTIAYAVSTRDHKNDQVIVFDRMTRKPLLTLEAYLPYVSTFTSDGQALAYMVEDGIALWDFNRQEKILLWESSGSGGVQFASVPVKNILAVASAFYGLLLYDIDAGSELPTPSVELLYSLTQSVGFSPDGTMGVYISGITVIWDVESGKQIAGMAGHTCHATSADFTPDGKILATSSYDDTILIWDLVKSTEIYAARDF